MLHHFLYCSDILVVDRVLQLGCLLGICPLEIRQMYWILLTNDCHTEVITDTKYQTTKYYHYKNWRTLYFTLQWWLLAKKHTRHDNLSQIILCRECSQIKSCLKGLVYHYTECYCSADYHISGYAHFIICVQSNFYNSMLFVIYLYSVTQAKQNQGWIQIRIPSLILKYPKSKLPPKVFIQKYIGFGSKSNLEAFWN